MSKNKGEEHAAAASNRDDFLNGKDAEYRARYECIRLERPPLFADVLCDVQQPSLYTYVIQREGSKEILGWGQVRSLKQAKEQVEAAFRELKHEHPHASHSSYGSPECTS